jgi:hypothetical protein
MMLLSIRQFCDLNGPISPSTLRRLWADGKGPRFVLIGNRKMISREAAAEWRKSLETENAAA